MMNNKVVPFFEKLDGVWLFFNLLTFFKKLKIKII